LKLTVRSLTGRRQISPLALGQAGGELLEPVLLDTPLGAAADLDTDEVAAADRWNRASPLEQQYMVAMAQHLGADGSAGTGQVAAVLSRPSPA